MTKLKNKGIISRPLWRLNHLQEPYRQNQAFAIERAAWYGERVLNLPSSVNLSEGDRDRVIAAIRSM